MRRIEELRKEIGLSIGGLANITGIPKSSIFDFEKGKIKKLGDDRLNKIAEVLNCDPEELGKNVVKKPRIKMKCLNENCPLNKNKKCDNDVVLEGRAPCYGKDKIQAKQNDEFKNTKILFLKE